jgi:plasmid segregation protein ParM
MSSEALLFAGVDDGHRETKVVLSDGRKCIIPSRAMSGLSNRIAINGARNRVMSYQTDEGPFSAGAVEMAEDTGYDDYPTSAQNRVIVAHALRECGLDEHQSLSIVTGLPLKRFYLNGKPNAKLIAAKIENLMHNDVAGLDGYRPPAITKHQVVSEAIAAWVNYVLVRNAKGKLDIDHKRAARRTAIIDLGGRTLDIAVVNDWELDRDRSTTDEIGMITIIEGMRERLFDHFNGTELSDAQVEQSVRDRTVRVWGQDHDVGHILDQVIQGVVNSLKATIKRRLRNAQDIDSVFFLGGTSAFLQQHLQGWFPNQEMVEDPVFANAMGMLKYAEFVMGRK